MKIGAKSTGENWRDNWITSQPIFEAVHSMWPQGWLDPCPTNPTFDGLNIDATYEGPIPLQAYINPPFSDYKTWATYWLERYKKHGGEQIWLCHTNNSSSWFHLLQKEASALCLLYERVKFIDPRTMEPSKNTAFGKSQALLYVGHQKDRFKEKFEHLGCIWFK